MKKITKIDKIQHSKADKKKLRVAAYCRVSTDSDAQLESLETQKTHYESYISTRDDWEFAGLYFDEGVTGTKASKRPQIMRLIKVYETERLTHFCERGEMLQEYNEDLFELFIDHIHVYSRQEVGFVLHCGLTFKERI